MSKTITKNQTIKTFPKVGRKNRVDVVILAAGEADRMRSFGPRPLLKITPEKNLLEHQIDIIQQRFSSSSIVLVCGHEAEKVMGAAPRDIIKVENEKYTENNIVRSLSIGLRCCSADKVVFIYGDLLFNAETFMNAKLDRSTLILDTAKLFSNDSVGCTFDTNGIAEQVLYELPNKWAQIAMFTGKELELLKGIVWNRTRDRWFGWEAVNAVINKGGKLYCEKVEGMKAMDIDCSKDLKNIGLVI